MIVDVPKGTFFILEHTIGTLIYYSLYRKSQKGNISFVKLDRILTINISMEYMVNKLRNYRKISYDRDIDFASFNKGVLTYKFKNIKELIENNPELFI